MRKKNRLIYGVGINDANYEVQKFEKVDNKWKQTWICPIYQRWKDTITRGYSEKFKERNPTYKDCTVDEGWHRFSNFKKWMDDQDWEGKCLDKDLLFPGNKVYSPETCVFIDKRVNNFLTDSGKTRGEFLIGVHFHKRDNTFQSHCKDPFKINTEYLGIFNTEQSAHEAWRKTKHKYALQLAELETDPRIIEALSTRYLSFKPKTCGEIVKELFGESFPVDENTILDLCSKVQ